MMHMHKEMNEEKRKMIVDELKKLGIKEDKIDDYMIWGVMKMMMGMMKMRWSLKEGGMKEADVKKMLDKITDKMIEMDMSKEMEEWKEKKEHCHHC